MTSKLTHLNDQMTFGEFSTNLRQSSLTKISETEEIRKSGTVRVKVRVTKLPANKFIFFLFFWDFLYRLNLVKHWDFGQQMGFWSKIGILVKN